jgi:predicted transcriptional regulator
VAKKVQVVLDDDTYRLLEELAHPRAGNKSFVVREALRYFADREAIERALDGILAQRHAREAMEAGILARNQDRLLSHASVVGGSRRKQKAR